MTSIDSGVETGNDSNDSVIVQHENQQQHQHQQQSQQCYIASNSTHNNFATTNPTEIDNKQDKSELDLFHIKINVPDDIMNTLDTSFMDCYVSSKRSLLVADYKMGVRMSSPKMLPDRHSMYRINQIHSTYGRRATKLTTKHYGSMSDSSIAYFIQARGRKMRFAAITNNTIWMRELLDKGTSPNIVDDYGRTPLHHAATRGFTEMVHLLLNYGADPYQQDYKGYTPLQLATMNRKASVVTLLSETSTVLSYNKYTPLKLVQIKLDRLKNVRTEEDIKGLKQEIQTMMFVLEKSANLEEKQDQVERLSNIYSRLSLSNSDKIQDDIKDLLAHIGSLRITNTAECNEPSTM